jgi:site-specific DNA recombinase
MRPQRPTTQRRGRRVYEYIRVSTAREEMISPELQHQHNLACAAREGLTIVDTIYDLDLSGREFAKRKVTSMVKGIADRAADGILVWKYSRWGRNLTDSLTNIRALEDAGGYIVSSTEPGDVETPHGKFSLHMLLVIAELQSDQIKESWLDSQWNRISQGLPGNGKPRFGYTYDKAERQYTPDPLTAPWLAKAYRQYIKKLPLSAVVMEMTEAGIRGTGGQPLVHGSMLFILDSGFGAGKIIVGARRGRASKGDPIYYPGAQEPVIEEDEWQAYQDIRAERRAPRHVNPVSRFSGHLRCGSCGRNLNRFRTDGAVTWGCRNTVYNSTTPCPAKAAIRESKLNVMLSEWLHEHARMDGYDEAAARAAAAEEAQFDLDQLTKEADELEQALIRLEDRLLRGKLDEARADVLREEYNGELAENRKNQGRLSRRAIAPVVPTPDMFESLEVLLEATEVDETIVNAFLSQLIRRIEVYPVSAGTRIRVIPAWTPDGDDLQADA